MSLITAQKFQLIQGGATPTPPWKDLRSVILARSPFDRERSVIYRLAQTDIGKALRENRRQPLLDAWSMVLGEAPPFPNISRWADRLAAEPLISIKDAHACFRGIKRPLGQDDRGWNVVAYVSRPTWFFCYEPSMVCQVRPEKVPDDVVFVTYVRLDEPVNLLTSSTGWGAEATKGVITHWGFVEADGNLPVDHKERFRKKLW